MLVYNPLVTHKLYSIKLKWTQIEQPLWQRCKPLEILNLETLSLARSLLPPPLNVNKPPQIDPAPKLWQSQEYLRTLYEELPEVHTIKIRIYHCNDNQWLNTCKDAPETIKFGRQNGVNSKLKHRNTQKSIYPRYLVIPYGRSVLHPGEFRTPWAWNHLQGLGPGCSSKDQWVALSTW